MAMPHLLLIGQENSLTREIRQQKLPNKNLDNISRHMNKFCWAILLANRIAQFLLFI